MGLFSFLSGLFGGGAAGVPADKQAYIGDWTADGVTLSIAADGEVRFRQVVVTETADGTSTNTRNVSGPISEWKGDSFVVGVLGNNTEFKVDAPPSGGSMTVNGIALTRQA